MLEWSAISGDKSFTAEAMPWLELGENSGRLTETSKRVFDLTVATILLACLLPLMLLVGISVRLTSRGPAIYAQRRLTRGGKTFVMYKFRTMTQGAEKLSGAVMAKENDVRVTPLGKFLRTTRIDELPQLLNVIIGDMSLIGPRPERPEIAAQLEKELPQIKRRLEVKAGLTGLAQITNGYADCVDTYREKLAWDLLYIERQSFLLDLKIAWRTIWVIFSGFGAR